MCGINGLINPTQKKIKKMNQLIGHRGPDDEGIYFDQKIALGHLRLSIIDTSAKGKQPMWTADGNYAIVFNGEIYNFKQIKNYLEKFYKFKNQTDTEVMLYAYHHWREKCLSKLNGMFAFCIYDKTKQQLFMARDRFGQKPFYYTFCPDFAFSSEIKALLILKPARKNSLLNLKSFDELMTMEHTFGQQTLCKNICELPPGHYLTYDLKSKKIAQHQYYWLKLKTDSQTSLVSFRKQIRQEFEQSVKRVLVADVPVGTYLSGGIDSSAITAITSQNLPYDTHSFSLIFADEKIPSEVRHMQSFLKKYPKVHQHFVNLTPQNYWHNFAKCTWHNDYPLVFAADVAQYLLAKEAKKYVKVVLSGQGADEIFGGYGRHRLNAKALGFYHGNGSLLLYKLIQAYSLLIKKSAADVNLNSFFSPELAQAMMINFFHGYRKKFLYGKNLRQFNDQPLKNQITYQDSSGADYLARFLYREINAYLKTILHNQDRMNMACGVEGRMPFLDHHLVQMALDIPLQYKVSQTEGKIIFKQVIADLLPAGILHRPKEGFTIPFIYLLGKINWGKTIFEKSRLVEDGLLSRFGINYYYQSKNSQAVYFLLATEIWYRLFIRGEKIIQVNNDLISNLQI